MTTLYNKKKTKNIQFALQDAIYECAKNVYIIEMPTLVCSNKKDAEIMQQEINTYISELSRALLDDK